MRRVLLFPLVLPLLGAQAAQAGQVRESTTYFMVQGSTLEEMGASLARGGPVVAATGLRHAGATNVSFDGRVTYKDAPKGCAVDEVHMSLDLEMVLPKWQRPAAAADQTTIVWRTLSQDIERHEKKHAAIARLWLKKLESAIRNLRPERDCASMEVAVNRISKRFLNEHERAQQDFDKIEGREVGLRLRRSLRDISRQIADAEND